MSSWSFRVKAIRRKMHGNNAVFKIKEILVHFSQKMIEYNIFGTIDFQPKESCFGQGNVGIRLDMWTK